MSTLDQTTLKKAELSPNGSPVKICNVVATAHLNRPLDLNFINEHAPNSQYLLEKFSGLLLRVASPCKGHCQLYANGKITINGGVSVRHSRMFLKKFVNLLLRLGIDNIRPSDCKVRYYVATILLGNSWHATYLFLWRASKSEKKIVWSNLSVSISTTSPFPTVKVHQPRAADHLAQILPVLGAVIVRAR